MPRKKTVKKQKVEDKIIIQFKLGRVLLNLMQFHYEKQGMSRNTWITSAVLHLLQRDKPRPIRISAEELLSNKITVQARLDKELVDLIDEVCTEKKIPRTIFVTDAILTKLSRRREIIRRQTKKLERDAINRKYEKRVANGF